MTSSKAKTTIPSSKQILLFLGEEPRGIWRLRVTDNIEDNDFLSQEQTDVEDLEEQVIDTQTKMQKSKWDAMRAQVSMLDSTIKYYILYVLHKH